MEAEHRRQSAGAAWCESVRVERPSGSASVQPPTPPTAVGALLLFLGPSLPTGPNPLAEARHVGRGLESSRARAEEPNRKDFRGLRMRETRFFARSCCTVIRCAKVAFNGSLCYFSIKENKRPSDLKGRPERPRGSRGS